MTLVECIYPDNVALDQAQPEKRGNTLTADSTRPTPSISSLLLTSRVSIPDPGALPEIRVEGASSPASTIPDIPLEHPDYESYYDSGFLVTPVVCAVLIIVSMTLSIMWMGFTGFVYSVTLFDGYPVFLITLTSALCYLISCILFCFLISGIKYKAALKQEARRRIPFGLRACLLVTMSPSFAWAIPIYSLEAVVCLPSIPAAMVLIYFLASVSTSIRRWCLFSNHTLPS